MAKSPQHPDKSRQAMTHRLAARIAGIFASPTLTSPDAGTAPVSAKEAASRPAMKFWAGLKRRLISYGVITGILATACWVDTGLSHRNDAWQFSQSPLGQELQTAQDWVDELGWHTNIVLIDSEAIEAATTRQTRDQLAAAIGSQMADRMPLRAHYMYQMKGGYEMLAARLQADAPYALNQMIPGFTPGTLPSTGQSDWALLNPLTEKFSIIVIHPDLDKSLEQPLTFLGNIYARGLELKGGLDKDMLRQFIIWHEVGHGLDHSQMRDHSENATLRGESFGDAFAAIELISRHGPQPEFFTKFAGLRTTSAIVLADENGDHGLGHYTVPVLKAAADKASALHAQGKLQQMDVRQKLDLALSLVNRHAPSTAEQARIVSHVKNLRSTYGQELYRSFMDDRGELHSRLGADIAASDNPADTATVKAFFSDNAAFRQDWLQDKPQDPTPIDKQQPRRQDPAQRARRKPEDPAGNI